jgi:DNA-binding winged helix-turn-helix (wHTH) protein/TolB-like protein/tetratricopeptide (TPR) repeat protein
MTNQDSSIFRFDGFSVETRNFKLFKAEEAIPLEPKTFLLLAYLIQNRDRLVEKRELLDAVWKDVAVTENALTREIGKLRRSLGDDPKTPKYIETVHTRGYRFIGRVETERPLVAPTASKPASEPVPQAPEFALPAVQGPMADPWAPVSRWVPYKLFVGLSIAIMLAASGWLLLRRAPDSAKPGATRGIDLTKPVFAKTAKPDSTTLAVLPFQSLGSDDHYVGLAFADALITKLTNCRQLAVQPLSTVLHYADSKADSLAIGREMNVDYVLEGKYQKVGDHTRVTVQLLCIVCNGASKWAGSFDENSSDVFRVQDSISQKVVAALPVELTGEEQMRMAKRETSQPEAQLAVFKGKFMQDKDTKEALEKSIVQLQAAIERDPRSAAGWVLLADSYRRREWYGGDPAQFLPLTREATRKANELDGSVPYAHSMLGLIAFQYDWDFATAQREYLRAREIQPSWVHQWYARMLLATNQPAEAEAEYKKFSKAMPFSVSGGEHYAEFLFLTGQYDRAIEEIRRDLVIDPDFAPARELLGLVYEQQGSDDKAEQEFKHASDTSNGLYGLAALGHLYATKRLLRHTQQVFDDMRAHHRKDYYVSPYQFAVIHAALGYTRRALRELQQAYDEHSLSAQSLRCDPRLAELRRDPGYQSFAKKLGVL